MNTFIKILAVVGTGVVIGSVAGKFMKNERKQVSKILKDFVRENKFGTRSTALDSQDELELYFI